MPLTPTTQQLMQNFALFWGESGVVDFHAAESAPDKLEAPLPFLNTNTMIFDPNFPHLYGR